MSSRRSNRFGARYSRVESSRLRPRCAWTRSVAATVSHAASGSVTGASSQNHAPSGNSATTSAATCSASRVLPTPPTPVNVTNGDLRSISASDDELVLTADERRDLARQVPRQQVERAQRRELSPQAGRTDLVDAFHGCEIAQPVLAQIGEVDRAVPDERTLVANDTTIWPPCATLIRRAARFTSLP